MIASTGRLCGDASSATPDTDELVRLKRQGVTLEEELAVVRSRLTPEELSPGQLVAVVDRAVCALCGICASSCPNDAIELTDAAEVDLVKCSGCGACAYLCPVHAIQLERVA